MVKRTGDFAVLATFNVVVPTAGLISPETSSRGFTPLSYKKAGVARWLMGMENYDAATLLKIKKGGSPLKDREAIRLLRQHDILSMATWVVGFEEETARDYWHGLKQLLSYDPDQIQVMYVTPHRWTPFFREAKDRRVIQLDQRKWDYKHQVLHTRHLKPWQVLLWVKGIECVMQLRPRSLARLAHHDRPIRACIHWYYRVALGVLRYEIAGFFRIDRHTQSGPTLREFWGEPQDAEENALEHKAKRRGEIALTLAG